MAECTLTCHLVQPLALWEGEFITSSKVWPVSTPLLSPLRVEATARPWKWWGRPARQANQQPHRWARPHLHPAAVARLPCPCTWVAGLALGDSRCVSPGPARPVPHHHHAAGTTAGGHHACCVCLHYRPGQGPWSSPCFLICIGGHKDVSPGCASIPVSEKDKHKIDHKR